MRTWSFLRPTTQKLIALVLISLVWLIPTSKEAIMKGTWEQHHGFPFTFIFLIESTIGGRYNSWISHFVFESLVADIVILYLVSCIILFVQKEKV
jgi:hypothetical protein